MTLHQRSQPSYLILISLLGLLSFTGVSALPYAVDRHDIDVTAMTRRADASKCSALNVDDAKKMPGWDKLEKYAKDTWGDGGWNIVTNPKEYLDRSASACVKDDKIIITPKGSPQCSTRTNNLVGSSSGTYGTATVGITTGESTEGSWTVTQSSAFSIGTEFSVTVGIEGLFDASSSITTSTTIENTNSRSFTTKKDSTSPDNIETNTKDGNVCGTQLNITTCNQDGEGKIRIVATGYVWFNYEDARAPKKDPHGHKHYKYAAKIDDVLSLDERSSWLSFSGTVRGTSNGHYKQVCNPNTPGQNGNGGGKPKNPPKDAKKSGDGPKEPAPSKDPKAPADKPKPHEPLKNEGVPPAGKSNTPAPSKDAHAPADKPKASPPPK